MNKMLVHGATEVVTLKGQEERGGKAGMAMNEIGVVYDNSIVIVDGIIKEVIPSSEVDVDEYKRNGYEIIDAHGKCVTPGFVDSHTHFIFGGYRADEYDMRLKGRSYMDIMNAGGGIVSSVTHTRNATKEELKEVGRKRLNSMLSFGVTTVEGKSGYGLNAATEIRQLEVMKELNGEHPIDIVPTFMGPHAVPKDRVDDRNGFLRDMIAILPRIKREELAEFADIFCEDKVFSVEESRTFLTAARQAGFKLKIHADEITTLGGAELAGELQAVSADHLLKASDAGLDAMKQAGVVATLLPLTAFSLKEDYARARDMIDRGMVVALATDFNPGSCFSESIPLMIAIATNQMKMTMEEVLSAITINGAAALGRSAEIGSIEAGKRADLIIHEFPSYKFMAYHIAVSTVETVIKNGVVVLDKKSWFR